VQAIGKTVGTLTDLVDLAGLTSSCGGTLYVEEECWAVDFHEHVLPHPMCYYADGEGLARAGQIQLAHCAVHSPPGLHSTTRRNA
jgi:hypothetical protein